MGHYWRVRPHDHSHVLKGMVSADLHANKTHSVTESLKCHSKIGCSGGNVFSNGSLIHRWTSSKQGLEIADPAYKCITQTNYCHYTATYYRFSMRCNILGLLY